MIIWGKKGSIMIAAIALLMLAAPVGPALAQSAYHIKEMTPPVKAALDSRRDRFEELAKFKQQGFVGENNKGYVQVLVSGRGAEALVKAENADRKTIYAAIAEQNNLGGVLDKIEEVFAEVQRDKAQAGEKVQMPDGTWVAK